MAGYRGYDVSYKVLLIGESGVGKTAIIRSLIGRDFSTSYQATVGIDFVKKVFDIDGAKIQLQIWDTAGQERFRTITRFQYRGTKGLMLVYDTTCKSSFSMLNYWMDSVDKELDVNNKEPIPVIIIGNKCDLAEARQITREQGKRFADRTFVHAFLETSAKNKTNVDRAFSRLAHAITEINNPKMLNSYLNPEERKEKEVRRMGQVNLISAVSSKPIPRNSSRIKLGIETGKGKLKCTCN